jgi:quinolinate synthase
MIDTACANEISIDADQAVIERIKNAREILGEKVVILGHHYQRDQVVQFADFRGDSFKLCEDASQVAAQYIVFAGVHFMAESAAILGRDDQIVILPELTAGCMMADMANLEQVQDAWNSLYSVFAPDEPEIVPITYMNSAADLKAFVGKNGGAVCTSSNARGILEWAFERGKRVFFFPDQHLGRNTGKAMGIPTEEMVLWNPFKENGGLSKQEIREAKIILWHGYCGVHQKFLPKHVTMWRETYPDINILVHPECMMEVVDQADYVGSTGYIIKSIEAAEPGSKWAIGTEYHLVNRLKTEHPDKTIELLSDDICACVTMRRISPERLEEVLEALVDKRIINQITVPSYVAHQAKKALDRMLAIPK